MTDKALTPAEREFIYDLINLHLCDLKLSLRTTAEIEWLNGHRVWACGIMNKLSNEDQNPRD